MRRPLVLLAAITLFSLRGSVWASDDIKIATVDHVIEVSGGGRQRWKLRYANSTNSRPLESEETHLVSAGPDRAYFSHGPWLRWIDTKRGIVIGRWLLPGRITNIAPDGEQTSIAIADKYAGRDFDRNFTFDPSHAKIPPGMMQNLVSHRLPETEAFNLFTPSAFEAVPPERARAQVPEIAELVRRDPLSPWFRILLGKIMFDAGDPGASTQFKQAIELPIDYTELLPISSYFENTRFPQLADQAFERGYGDLLRREMDPRITGGIIARLVFYLIDWKRIDPARHAAVVERMFQLTPYGEASELAWTSFARSAKSQDERNLWNARAGEARRDGVSLFEDLTWQSDVVLLIGVSCGLAKFWFVLVSYVRYRPQRTLDKKVAKQTKVSLWRRIPFLNIQYWSLPQRLGFVLIFVVAWFCAGWAKQSLTGDMLVAEQPIVFGSWAGPVPQWFFANRLPPTPERDFLMAFADQQSGNDEDAVRLYQQTPQFAESWNNLGVIRRKQGKESEALGAFQQALRVDPNLAEAALNLGRPASDYWTRIHQQYVPDSPMMASPPKQLVMNAFVGGPVSWRLRVAWRDALQPWHFDPTTMSVIEDPSKSHSAISILVKAGICLALFLFLLPRLPVHQSSRTAGTVLATLFPGTARKWQYAGGIVLLVWMYFVAQAVCLWFGSPYIMTYIAVPNLMRAYGAPETPIESLIKPGWMWVYLAPAALFLLNFLMVFPELRSRHAAVGAGAALYDVNT